MLISTCILIISSSFAAQAGQWRSDANGWWFQNDNGGYPTGTWEWLDDNGDGIAECYYFNDNGYMAYNKIIDGSYVNHSGQWVENGNIMRKEVSSVLKENKDNNTKRDFSFSNYLKTIPMLSCNNIGEYRDIYRPEIDFNNYNVIDRENCYEVENYILYAPVEFTSIAEAKASYPYQIEDEYVRLTPNGTYFIQEENDFTYDHAIWQGSVYISKDCMVKYRDYQDDREKEVSISDFLYKDLRFNRTKICVVLTDGINPEGYITHLSLVQWG